MTSKTAVALLATAAFAAAVAPAGAEPVGGCPVGYELVQAGPGGSFVDLNEDGFICTKPFKNPQGGPLNLIDNRVQSGTLIHR
jgi:hypothetical protein